MVNHRRGRENKMTIDEGDKTWMKSGGLVGEQRW